MQHRRTLAVIPLLAALVAGASLTGCAPVPAAAPQPAPAQPATSPAEQSSAADDSSEEPTSSETESTQSESDQSESNGQPQEHPGEGTGFGKCTADTLSMRVAKHPPEGVAVTGDLIVANVGTKACNWNGTPELKLFDSDNAALPTKVSKISEWENQITLQPGEKAKAILEWSEVWTNEDSSAGPCVNEPKNVEVTPMDSGEPKNRGPLPSSGRA